jgi:hypothetical protein
VAEDKLRIDTGPISCCFVQLGREIKLFDSLLLDPQRLTGGGADPQKDGRIEPFTRIKYESPTLDKRLHEVVRVQFLSGGAQDGGLPVVAGAGAEEGLLEVAARELVLVECPPTTSFSRWCLSWAAVRLPRT